MEAATVEEFDPPTEVEMGLLYRLNGVLALHKPDHPDANGNLFCAECKVPWRCRTYLVVTEEITSLDPWWRQPCPTCGLLMCRDSHRD